MQETWTQDDMKQFLKGGFVPKKPSVENAPRHRRSQPRGTMNKTEARYAFELEVLKRGGKIIWYAFEPITLRLAKRTSYTPDFLVMHNDGSLEFVETKGHWEDDARVKIKVAAKMFP